MKSKGKSMNRKSYEDAILVTAYKELNFGDDLFLKMLFERYSKQLFITSVNSRSLTFCQRFGNVVTFDEYTLMRRIIDKIGFFFGRPNIRSRMALSVRAIVDIGGSRYIEPWFPPVPPDGKKPFFVIGSNYGPAKSYEYQQKCADWFSRCTDVCLRDKRSYDLFSYIPQVRYAPDIVFGLNIDRAVPKENIVLFSLIDLNDGEHSSNAQYHDCYVESMASLCHDMISSGVTPFMVSFCAAQGDEHAADEVVSLLSNEDAARVQTIVYDGDLDKIIALFLRAKYVIGTRFHSIVMGLLAGALTLPIVYSVKTSSMLDDFGQPYTGFQELPAKISDVKFAYMDDCTYESVSREAEKQFAALDLFLA